MERKLAHIELITNLQPIEGADKIELATVLGWQCVVKKGEFKINDKIIFIEVDSVLPDKPEYEFLRSKNFRIRTIKLKGQISQGLIIGIPKDWNTKRSDRCILGSDVTEELNITKYLTPTERNEESEQLKKISNEKNKLKKFMMRYNWFRRLFLSRKQTVGFPYWVSKTDEERIQNMPKVLEQYKDELVYVTEKVDYQSATFTGKILNNTTPIIGRFLPNKFKFVVASRNMVNNDKSSLYWQIANKYNLEKILTENPTLTIQGEQGNTNVQGNKYNITEPKLWVFNIYNHEMNYHYSFYEMNKFCEKYNLTTVPLLAYVTLKDIATNVEEIVEFSKDKSVINPSINREGIVVRCIKGGKKLLSFKVINPDFLIKYSDE